MPAAEFNLEDHYRRKEALGIPRPTASKKSSENKPSSIRQSTRVVGEKRNYVEVASDDDSDDFASRIVGSQSRQNRR